MRGTAQDWMVEELRLALPERGVRLQADAVARTKVDEAPLRQQRVALHLVDRGRDSGPKREEVLQCSHREVADTEGLGELRP